METETIKREAIAMPKEITDIGLMHFHIIDSKQEDYADSSLYNTPE